MGFGLRQCGGYFVAIISINRDDVGKVGTT